MRGYFAIGIINSKTKVNVGTLWRTANILGAQYIFTIGKRYLHQVSDTLKTPRHIPLFEYDDWESFKNNSPKDCKIIAIELHKNSTPSKSFIHPERAIYLLGAEDEGIPEYILKECSAIVQLPGEMSLNVSVAGSIVIYDRISKYK